MKDCHLKELPSSWLMVQCGVQSTSKVVALKHDVANTISHVYGSTQSHTRKDHRHGVIRDRRGLGFRLDGDIIRP